MSAFRDPAFQDRIALAAKAKQAALDKLKAKAKAPVDEAAIAARIEARRAKEAAEAEKRAAKAAAREEERLAKQAAKEEARRLAEEEALKNAPKPKPELTEEERKAIRDARYAARKQKRR